MPHTINSLQRNLKFCLKSGLSGNFFRQILFSLSIIATLQTSLCFGQKKTPAPRDGQHDFDFNIGTWKTHIRRLSETGKWVELTGTVQVRKVWNGRAQLEEIDADGTAGHFEGLTLFLYHPDAHQWAQYFADSSDGTINPPQIGAFNNGRGELYDQEIVNGQMALVRFIWFDITLNAHKVEQSYSTDGGKTWKPNFLATLTRATETPTIEENFQSNNSDAVTGARDFDFHFGEWKTHVRRLLHPLSGRDEWAEYDGKSLVSKIWGGKASLLELDVTGPSGHIQGAGIRLFNPQSHQWSLNWVNGGSDPEMTVPMIGKFSNGQGRFYDQEKFQNRTIMSRNGFSQIQPNSSRFEQAFSDDAGQTWETNWIMTFIR